MKNPFKHNDPASGYQLIFILLATVFVSFGFSTGNDIDAKVVITRYLMIGYAGVLAFATPWVMFPQVPLYLYQALNPTPYALFKILNRRLINIYLPALVLVVSMALWHADPSSFGRITIFAIDSIVLVLGLTAYASYRYLRVGPVSQLWQEQKKGKKLLQALKETGNSTGVPAGSLPTIGTTVMVSVVGMLSVVLGAWLQGVSGLPFSSGGAVILLLVGARGWIKNLPALDVPFYHAHAFFQELFRNPGGKSDGGRDPLPYQALYWVPKTIKPLVWSTLRQMDRKVPVGRLVIIGIILYWSLIYGGLTDAMLLTGIPVVIIILKNVLLFRVTGPAFAPKRFQQLMGSPIRWFLARCFVNLRWSFPIYGFMLLTVWMVEAVNYPLWQFWILADIVLLISVSALITGRLENRIRLEFGK